MTLLAIATILNAIGIVLLGRASILNSKAIQRLAAVVFSRPENERG